MRHSSKHQLPRLLLLTPDFAPGYGGIQMLSQRLASCLNGFDTHVVTFKETGSGDFDAVSAIATRRVAARKNRAARANAMLNVAALAEALQRCPAAVLSMHAVCSPAVAAIRLLGGASGVQYFHANEICHRPALAAFAARVANRSVAVSSYTVELLQDAGARCGSVVVIPPGVDLPADHAPLAAERPTVLTVARLRDHYKGHDVLARAMVQVRERVADAQWVILGDGPLRRELEELCCRLGLDGAALFEGSVSEVQKSQWLRRADVFAMPSRRPPGGLAGEGFGIAFLEAGAYGKPVVAGNVGGALDAVSEGVSGHLVDPTDHRAVARAITKLLLDPAEARRLGAGGRARAERFAWPLIARRVEAELQAISPCGGARVA